MARWGAVAQLCAMLFDRADELAPVIDRFLL
jgi:hypothetical protein